MRQGRVGGVRGRGEGNGAGKSVGLAMALALEGCFRKNWGLRQGLMVWVVVRRRQLLPPNWS